MIDLDPESVNSKTARGSDERPLVREPGLAIRNLPVARIGPRTSMLSWREWESVQIAILRRRTLLLLVINLLGSIWYLIAVSPSWAIPEERESGIHSITGEPFVWATAGWPILALFFVVNLSWAVFILFKRRWQESCPWLITPFLWMVALWIDFAHH